MILLPLAPNATDADRHFAKELCGLPLLWACGWMQAVPLKTYLEECYGFPLVKIAGGAVAEDGIYSHPGEPDLKPLVKLVFDDCTFYQYAYGVVAIDDFVTRMD